MLIDQITIDAFRQDFTLDKDWIHLGLGILAPHSKTLNSIIDAHRTFLDKNPDDARRHRHKYNDKTLKLAAQYLGTHKNNLILTESTTLSLSLIYLGFKYNQSDEILLSEHEHYSVDALTLHARELFGVKVKKFNLFEDLQNITEEAIIERYIKNITENTRLISVTWVNSCFGVKLPVQKLTSCIRDINAKRPESKRIFTILDAVHGIGIENIPSAEHLGVDYIASGCHKWLFGPRGTGFLWASEIGWKNIQPLIPSFEAECWNAFMGEKFVEEYKKSISKPTICSPGGFRSFEYQWALSYAFENMIALGKNNVEKHIHSLCSLAKDILSESNRITLYTPNNEELSSGLICFNIKDLPAFEFSEIMKNKKIMAGYTPYKESSCRITPGLLNNSREVEKACKTILEIAQ
ncbi:aminotransferase class V-fold PLP-dependent enzyme [Xenorhabdus japonica]|uniref:Selenocysteine lyase/Cysteine desulfurase n=1 Tax=Xenorhabdus japonica TaxID=53341 RepID=A0A1I4YD43_9GAMM|nr:aminotransferase class V-fold PLP-dependent enzyme [Xenorhabdus japonica]SFN35968.1 Selenocysteine lyase/Cysteine desulfurase [Xenorhabdus japonica]